MAELTDITDWLRGRSGADGGGFTSADDVADAIERNFGGEALEELTTNVVSARRTLVMGLVTGLIAGGAAGYFWTRRLLELKYEKIAEVEIDEMRDHFRQRLVAKETKPDLSNLGKVVRDAGYVSEDMAPHAEPAPGELNTGVEAESETKNIFEEAKQTDEWDYEVEKAIRAEVPDKPYVIHYDERGESDNEEVTLTYYSGDDVLCDDTDKVIEDPEKVVGISNLDKFGHGSNDPVIVYVRNEKFHLDLEVVLSQNSYAEEVHGFKHEDSPRRRGKPEWR